MRLSQGLPRSKPAVEVEVLIACVPPKRFVASVIYEVRMAGEGPCTGCITGRDLWRESCRSQALRPGRSWLDFHTLARHSRLGLRDVRNRNTPTLNVLPRMTDIRRHIPALPRAVQLRMIGSYALVLRGAPDVLGDADLPVTRLGKLPDSLAGLIARDPPQVVAAHLAFFGHDPRQSLLVEGPPGEGSGHAFEQPVLHTLRDSADQRDVLSAPGIHQRTDGRLGQHRADIHAECAAEGLDQPVAVIAVKSGRMRGTSRAPAPPCGRDPR